MSTAIHGFLRRTLSLLLASVLFMSAALISAADFSSRTVGSVQGFGNVKLRGVSLAGEGTLFPGDAITTGAGSRGDLVLADGSKVELFDNTQCVLKDGSPHITVRLMAGNLGFTASKKPLAIGFSDFEVLPEPGTTGGVAFLSRDFAGVRVMTGSAVVRNLITGRSLKVSSGSVQIVDLKTTELKLPIAQVASTVAPPLPSGAPVPQAAPAGGGISPKTWAVIGAGVGAVTVTAIYFAVRNASPSKP